MSHPGQLTMILWQRCLHWTKLEISDSCCCLGRKANSIGEYTTIPVRVPWNLLHNGTERMQGPSSVSSLQITHYSHCLVSSYLLQLWICCCAALIVRCSHTWESPRLTRQWRQKCMEWLKEPNRQFFTHSPADEEGENRNAYNDNSLSANVYRATKLQSNGDLLNFISTLGNLKQSQS